MDSNAPDVFGKPVIPFSRLAPHEVQLCVALGERTAKLIQELTRQHRDLKVEAHPQIIAMDFATVHLTRPLRLDDLLRANVFELINEYTLIHANVNRLDGTFPVFVRLSFEQSRSSN